MAGQYYTVNETMKFEDLPTYLRASSAIPCLFPYLIKDKRVLVDGGVLSNLDVVSAIQRCKEIVDDPEDIIIDVVLSKKCNKF